MSRTKSVIRRAASVSWLAARVIRPAALIGVAMMCVPSAHATSGDAELDVLLAERMAQLADQILSEPEVTTHSMHQAVALLDIARDLNPNEFRFARSSADLCMRMGDRDRAIDALIAVRRIEPADQVAMIQFVDLVTSRMETAEQKVAYLKQIIDSKGVATEVQSHAAVQLMNLYYTRAEDADAQATLDMALKLNPQNIPALKAKYKLAASTGNTKDRVTALGELMRAAPTDADAMLAMAHEADACGSYENSGLFRMFAMQVNSLRSVAPSADEAINYVGTQMLAGQKDLVAGVINQLMQAMKEDGRVYTLAMLHQQLTGTETLNPEDVSAARGVYLAQLAGVSQLINEPDKTEMPTTNPAVPMPNVKADIAKLKESDPKQLSMAYAVALSEQLWFDLYFQAAEVDEASITALADLLGENDPIVVRFQGWKLLMAGKTEEARIKLEAVANRDGFARLGMIAANKSAGNKETARQEMTQMIRDRPSGMIAAYAAVAAKQIEVVADQSYEEEEISNLITPVRKWIGDVLANPRGFYLLTAQPEKVSYEPGEPMIASVTILNNGRTPITIGAGGMIDPTFVFDVEIRNTPPDVFTGVARGMFTGAIRLRPSQKVTQRVRIDRATLARYLRGYQTPLFPMTGYVTTNAYQDQSGASKSGAAGQQTRIGKAFERQSSPLYTEAFRAKAVDKISKGTAAQRMNMAELFGSIIGPLKSQTDNQDAMAVATTLEAALKVELNKETNPELKTWLQLMDRPDLNDPAWMLELATNKTLLGQVGSMVSARLAPKETRETVAKAVLETQPSKPIVEFAQALAAQGDVKPPEQELPQ